MNIDPERLSRCAVGEAGTGPGPRLISPDKLRALAHDLDGT